ncbi:MAG: LysR family transcriptional regulator substrate-binding protein [Burkholderiaceae bacterium]
MTHFSYWVIAPRGWEQRVLGRGWEGLAQLPWIGTADASVHRRLLRTVCEPMGIQLRYVAKVDQESSMLAMVRAGVGLSLCRDSIALSEMRSHGLVVNDRVQIRCPLSFLALQARRAEAGIAVAFDLLSELWTEPGRADVRPLSFEIREGRFGRHDVQLRQPAGGVVDE